IELDDGPARFEEIVESGGEGFNRWFHVVIMEGRQREVRRMWEAVGCQVSRLKRVRYGSVILESALKVGRWRFLKEKEIEELANVSGVKTERPKQRPKAKGKGYPSKGSKPGQSNKRSNTRQASRQSKPAPKNSPWKGKKSSGGRSR
ncbi:MAG: 23S rRNA pseudouridylate synthase B, partial [Candidatus Thiodiazotropha taylori]|nr:23S rRNA pseudouridylate synthase B [Candidatus Thiodiazotropha taylori]MCW4257354.1 23S rRNA pseudouridylate synthase B [Candidatus Thiodiazotropha taylori]